MYGVQVLRHLAIVGLLGWGHLPLSAPSPSPSSTVSQVNPITPIVRTRADLKRFDQQRVRLLGRYERFQPPRSTRPSSSSRPEIEPMTGIADFKPVSRPYGPAQIVLQDGWRVFIFPLWNKQSLRSPDELEDYDAKNVEVIGIVQWEQGNHPALAQSARLMGSTISLEQLQLNLQESKLYDPRSIVRVLQVIPQTPVIALKSWQFVQQRDQPGPSERWQVARDYRLEMTGALPTFEAGWQQKFPDLASDPYTLTLFRGIPRPATPAPKPGPRGEQSAFSTGAEPNHVIGFHLQYSAIQTGMLRPGGLPSTLLPTLKTVARACLGATEPEVQALDQLLPGVVQPAIEGKTDVTVEQPGPPVPPPLKPLSISVVAQMDASYHLKISLWRQDTVESRRIYCDLEPRNTRTP
ncbi:hypothetical protein BST81_23890 [Leptolyngbya sp. 'hensonii']|uniref:hypothetical protein n=1 Tax=Leptolyngbya sp. 'hensonii' TaxID=1922337 RepID=UPI00095022AE|nr:hypothetical protein [Leptolyngbya sp. 'hensonii']OLP15870.1 hypothetical protein BST81_23890 [Leptolyngbya sp. 'hensonii']